MRKLSLIAALALGGLMACSTMANAQDAPKKGGKRGMSIEQQMDRMTEQLTLTDEQKPKVKAVLEDGMKKRREIFTDSSLDQQARREKMKPLMEEQNKKMKEILTAEQYTKYQEMMQRRGKKGGEKKKKKSE